MYIIYIILHTFNPHNVKKTPHEEAKKTCVLKKKNLNKKPPQLDTDVRHRAVKKNSKKKHKNNY